MPTPESYLINYSHFTFSELNANRADLMIIETGLTGSYPVDLTSGQLNNLATLGHTVVGYVNMCVTDHQRTGWQDHWVNYTDSSEKDVGEVSVTAPDWLKNNRGTVDFDPEHYGYDGYIVDFKNENWQLKVIDQATTIVEFGYHGVILDDVLQYYWAGYFDRAPDDFDSSWADAMIDFVIRVSAAVHEIDPDAYVVLNSGLNIGEDGNYGPASAVWNDFLDSFDAMLFENQYANEIDPVEANTQDALSDALDRFPGKTILSTEDPDNEISFADYLSFCAARGILPYIPASYAYDGIETAPIMGTSGNDHLRANGSGQIIAGLIGHDQIMGGRQGDWLFGHQGNDILHGNGGDDQVFGGVGNDVIRGGLGTDILFGGNGFDRIFGGNDDDVLVGGAHMDILRGGSGADVFEFHAGDSGARIMDFEQGSDQLSIFSGAASLADIDQSMTARGVRLSFDGLWVEIHDLSVGDLTTSDAIFG